MTITVCQVIREEEKRGVSRTCPKCVCVLFFFPVSHPTLSKPPHTDGGMANTGQILGYVPQPNYEGQVGVVK